MIRYIAYYSFDLMMLATLIVSLMLRKMSHTPIILHFYNRGLMVN